MSENNLYPVVDIPEYEEENEEYDAEYKPSSIARMIFEIFFSTSLKSRVVISFSRAYESSFSMISAHLSAMVEIMSSFKIAFLVSSKTADSRSAFTTDFILQVFFFFLLQQV